MRTGMVGVVSSVIVPGNGPQGGQLMRTGMVGVVSSVIVPGNGPQGGQLMRSGMAQIVTSVIKPGIVFAVVPKKRPFQGSSVTKAPSSGIAKRM